MNKALLLLCLLFSVQGFASQMHTCNYGEFKISFVTKDQEMISLDVFKGETKISNCSLNILSHDDGKTGKSTDELFRFSLQGCRVVYDKIAAKVIINENGFVKIPSIGKTSFAYVVKNEQPLKCTIKTLKK